MIVSGITLKGGVLPAGRWTGTVFKMYMSGLNKLVRWTRLCVFLCPESVEFVIHFFLTLSKPSMIWLNPIRPSRDKESHRASTIAFHHTLACVAVFSVSFQASESRDSGFQVTGMIEGFWGLKFSITGFFGVRKFGKYFLCGLI